VALSGGIIILLDGLVKFAGDYEAVLGVLAHELGHVAHKHSTRQILLSVGVGDADIPELMSTHPSSEERLERLRRAIE
jgi:Zn-dependent protease with chaperone function